MNTTSPKWLEDPTPFGTVSSISRKEMIQRLSENPEVLSEFLTNLTVSLSNQQVKQTAEHGSRWLTDIENARKSEPLPEGETDSLESIQQANELLVALMTYTRTQRSVYSSKTNSFVFRKQ
jgi:hypothetical protein